MAKLNCRLSAIALSLSALGWPSFGLAYPAPSPEWQREALEVLCGENRLLLSLESHRLAPARLGAITVNGRPSGIGQREAVERFLTGLRGANLQAVTCRAPLSLVVAISGSRIDAPPDQEDDVTEVFELSFRNP